MNRAKFSIKSYSIEVSDDPLCPSSLLSVSSAEEEGVTPPGEGSSSPAGVGLQCREGLRLTASRSPSRAALREGEREVRRDDYLRSHEDRTVQCSLNASTRTTATAKDSTEDTRYDTIRHYTSTDGRRTGPLAAREARQDGETCQDESPEARKEAGLASGHRVCTHSLRQTVRW